ncbi:MAG: hypothetical protein V3S60_05495 [Acidimicrobiia bacterium]
MIRAFEPADEDDMIRVWLASTIPGQSFLPEEHWRAMEPEIRELVPIAEIWVVEEDGEIVAKSRCNSRTKGRYSIPGSSSAHPSSRRASSLKI